jgi:hypothetical protein
MKIKLLGNDAAHVEAKTYDEIGKEEIEAIIELTRELPKYLSVNDHIHKNVTLIAS